jgi:hypothetical protein
MEENRIPIWVLYMNLVTRRLRDTPRNTWQDEVREEWRIVDGVEWEEEVYNRQGWKKLLRKARNCHILLTPMKWITLLCRDRPTKCTEVIYFFIFFYDDSYMFRQNNAILRERLFSFLSHFSVKTVGDKSGHMTDLRTVVLYSTPVCRFRHMSYDLSPTVLTLKWLRKENSPSLRMALFCRNT